MAAKKILIVDDELRLREMISMILKNRGYQVIEGSNGAEAVTLTKTESPDLILLDVMMPIMNGFSACETIRNFYEGPILMLTAKGEDVDQVIGLEKGADDYIIKPFTPMVLAARVQAALRRGHHHETDTLSVGHVSIDLKGRDVTVCNEHIALNRKEFDLLVYLAENRCISLSRDQILENVWGYDYLGSDSTVDSHINRLRNKLGVCEGYIKTVRGYGYRFEAKCHE